MYLIITISSIFISLSRAKPIWSCSAQEECLTVQRTPIDSTGQQVEVCLIYSGGRQCDSRSPISSACMEGSSDKFSDWNRGTLHRMCKTVDCGTFAIFGVNDGRSCRGTISDTTLGGTFGGIQCQPTFYCGGGRTGRDCRWKIPAGTCPTPGPTTAGYTISRTDEPTPQPTLRYVAMTDEPTESPTDEPTPSPTTRYVAVTEEPTTAAPTTASPTTAAPTTANPTTASPTTASPTTANPTTAEPTTASPTTAAPTTASPTTASPTTAAPTTADPTTASPTTAEPTTASPTTARPTTAAPTTANPTTASPTTAAPTTADPTTAQPTTANPTTAAPTTAQPTTASPTTADPTTASPTTALPTTASPTTAEPTTASPTTAEPTTASPTTANPTTADPTTLPTSEPTPDPTPRPTPLPTTLQPTAAPTFTECATNDSLNIGFLLDESGSVDLTEWIVMTNFVERIITYDISPSSYVALYEYASLQSYTKFQDFTPNVGAGQTALIDAMEIANNPYNPAGTTRTWDAVNRVLDDFWSYRNSCTDGCQTRSDLFFLVTDGVPTGETVCPNMTARMSQSAIDVVVIIIDPDGNIDASHVDCLDVNNNGADIYHLPDFDSDAFNSIEARIRNKTCNGENPAGPAVEAGEPWIYPGSGQPGLGPVPTGDGGGGCGGCADATAEGGLVDHYYFHHDHDKVHGDGFRDGNDDDDDGIDKTGFVHKRKFDDLGGIINKAFFALFVALIAVIMGLVYYDDKRMRNREYKVIDFDDEETLDEEDVDDMDDGHV